MQGIPLALHCVRLLPSPAAQARLVAVSRLSQRCLAVLLWAGCWDFALLPSSGGFICIIHCCLDRLSRCFCNQPHGSQGWGKSKSWESISLPRTWEQAKEKPNHAASLLQCSFSHFILDLGSAGQVVGSTML